MHQLSPAQWLAVLPTLAALTVSAQNAAAPTATIQSPSVSFRSAFEGYQPYTDEKIANWKESNDNTGRIGGWREYAKEASQPGSGAKPQAADTATKPDPRAVPAKP